MTLVVSRIEKETILLNSDTLATDEFGLGLVRELSQNRADAPILKLINLHPTLCVAVAGATEPFRDFLLHFYSTPITEWSSLRVLNSLFEIHSRTKNATEFIFASATSELRLVEIKGGRVETKLKSAWIGDHDAFELYQSQFHSSSEGNVELRMFDALNKVIESDRIPSVGGIQIKSYSHHTPDDSQNGWAFLYRDWSLMTGGFEKQRLEANVRTAIDFGTIATGSFGIVQFRSVSPFKAALAVHFPPSGFGVLFYPSENQMSAKTYNADNSIDFIERIWEDHEIPLEGTGFVDGRIQPLKNF